MQNDFCLTCLKKGAAIMQNERDRIIQYLRVHTETDNPTQTTLPSKQTYQTSYDYYLVFDTETTSDEQQTLRFGVYQLYGMHDDLRIEGIFYNPAIPDNERALLKDYALSHDMRYVSFDKFVSLLYAFAHNKHLHTLVIGHNLPFDLSRLAQEIQFPKGDFTNGFSLKLCTCSWQRSNRKRSVGDSCKRHPSIRVKKISPKACIFEFADKCPRGCFLDTATLARALLGPGSTSLDSLGHVLGIAEKKLENAVHGASLTDQYIGYACRDVTATWQIFQKLRDIYAGYNFSQKVHNIFSEASLGKALYKELGISPPMSRMQNISPEVHGYAMATYYGGRSEVHMRKEEAEIAYCDFKSQYPTIFHLMGLQDMLLAERYEIVDVTAEIDMKLDYFNLDVLQDVQNWQQLRVLCKVSGRNLILPVRSKFNGQTNNIALCNVELQSGVWYTLSDILASILLGGDIPHIEQALEIIPVGRIETNELAMFDGLVTINPHEQGIFTTLIDERTRIKKLAETATGDEKDKLDRTQTALKLLANSTSYGINIELRTEDVQDTSILLYGNDGCLHAASAIMQKPGTFYCPLIGTHIPSGGRLLLAIAQRLAADRGLSYAMCDTDSMSFIKPPEMARRAFKSHIESIVAWFRSLYPYNDTGELFELEKYNYWNKELEPLFFLGVSAKRYILYNKLGTETVQINDYNRYARPVYRIRKVSSHGLGAFRISDSYQSPAWIPEPTSLKDVGLTQHTRWIYDIWYEHVVMTELYGGFMASQVEPAWERLHLDTPAYQQTTLNTAYLYKLFARIPGIKPFNFVTTFFNFTGHELQQRIKTYPELAGEYEQITSCLYVPYTTHVEQLNTLYVLQSNRQVTGIKPLTIEEALTGYFEHPESKAKHGNVTGEMLMRHVSITGYVPQGKESSYEVYELEDAGLPTSLAREAINLEYMTVEKWQALKDLVRDYGVNAMARRLGTYPVQVSRMLASSKPPNHAVLQQMKKSLAT